MGAQVDKLFLELNGCPVVAHTWRRFDEAGHIDEIVLVVRNGMQAAFTELAGNSGSRSFRLVGGGPERQDSVWNGLEALSAGAEIVAIQDAARPCTSQALIAATIAAARETGAAVAAQPVTDTIKESSDGKLVERTLDRSRLWAVQTPQTFRVEIIRRALAEVRQRGLVVTDDTAACELIGQPVQLVPARSRIPRLPGRKTCAYVEMLLRAEGRGLRRGALKPEDESRGRTVRRGREAAGFGRFGLRPSLSRFVPVSCNGRPSNSRPLIVCQKDVCEQYETTTDLRAGGRGAERQPADRRPHLSELGPGGGEGFALSQPGAVFLRDGEGAQGLRGRPEADLPGPGLCGAQRHDQHAGPAQRVHGAGEIQGAAERHARARSAAWASSSP